jgi:hypothetical protein
MKKIVLFAVYLLSFSLAFSQENTVVYDKNAQVRTVSAFKAIKVSSGIQLYLKQGNSEGVAVSAEENEYRDKIKTVVENGVLKIYYDNESWFQEMKSWNKKLKAYVTIRTLEKLNASAGASVKIDGKMKSDKLSIDLSSGSMLRGELEAYEIAVDQSSGSIADVSGTTINVKVDASSGSIFRGYDLSAANGDVDGSSGAVIQVTVQKEMKAEASSGAGVRYKGDGVIRSVSTSSGGSVNRRR